MGAYLVRRMVSRLTFTKLILGWAGPSRLRISVPLADIVVRFGGFELGSHFFMFLFNYSLFLKRALIFQNQNKKMFASHMLYRSVSVLECLHWFQRK